MRKPWAPHHPVLAAIFAGATLVGSLLATPGAGQSAATIRFDTGTSYTTCSSPWLSLACDLDGVNGPDLVTMCGNALSILPNSGNGSFGSAESVDMGMLLLGFSIVDLDGDGHPDLIAAGLLGSGDVGLAVRRGLGGFSFAPVALRRITSGSLPSHVETGASVVIGDVTGDHVPDIVVDSWGADSLWIFAGNGTISPGPARAVPIPVTPIWLQLADFDGDGLLDVAAFCSSVRHAEVSVLLNRGDGTFRAMPPIVTVGGVQSFTALDADADGRLDLAVISAFNPQLDQVMIAMGHGDGIFDAPVPVAEIPAQHESWPTICTADVDRDGHADLVSSCSGGGLMDEMNFCIVTRGLGNGLFAAPRVYLVGPEPEQVLVSDLDADGAPDLIIGWHGGGVVPNPGPSVTVLHNRGDGSFDAQLKVLNDLHPEVAASTNGAVEVAHLRPGATRDLVVTDSHRTFVLLNELHDDYSPPIDVGYGDLGACADLNGDGLEDLVLTGPDSTWIWRSLGDGRFESAGLFTGDHWIGIADLDGDGRPDLAFVEGSGHVAMRRGVGGGSFGDLEPLDLTVRPETPRLTSDDGVGYTPAVTTFADLDGDGLADAASALPTGCYPYDWEGGALDTLVVQFNLGNGRFSDPSYCELPHKYQDGNLRPMDVAAGDLTGDGRTDLVVLHGNGTGSDMTGSLSRVINAGNRTFQHLPPLSPGSSAADLHLADLNLDGLVDVITVNSNGGTIFGFEVQENTAAGDMLSSTIRAAEYSSAVGVGDLDGDGLPDIATYSPRWGSVVVTRNHSLHPDSTGTPITLLDSHAEPGFVSLAWSGGVNDAPARQLYRRPPDGSWTLLATLEPDVEGVYRYDDRSVVAGRRYGYRLGIPGPEGETYAGETWIDVPAQLGYALEGVRPNPSTSGPLTVSFVLATAAPARLELLDVFGRRIATREVGALGPGRHAVDLSGEATLTPALYFVRLTAAGRTLSTRATVLR